MDYLQRKREIIFGFLLLNIFVVSLAANNITFWCQEGWLLLGTHCYNFIDVKMDYVDAHDQCSRLGSSLISLRDEAEALQVSQKAGEIFHGSTDGYDYYWIRNSGSPPSGCKSFWEPGQPENDTDHKEDRHEVASNFHGRWKKQWYKTNLLFVCRSPACPEGSFRCSDGKCINDKWRCDGIFDCADHSDETDNFDKERCAIPDCYKHYRLSEGTIDTDLFKDIDSCQWILEGKPGQVLKLEIEELQLTEHTDRLKIYAGGPSIASSSSALETELTEDTKNFTFLGMNQFLILTLHSRASGARPVLKASWEPDPDLSLGQVEKLAATKEFQTIMTPYFGTDISPKWYKKEWLLTADPGEIIILDTQHFTFTDEEDTEIPNLSGSIMQPLKNLGIYISEKNHMSVILKNYGLPNRIAEARFKTGCDIEFETTSAEMELGELPPGSHCTLKIVNPLGSNFSLGALYKFDDDDDFLKVYAGVGEVDEANLKFIAQGSDGAGVFDLPGQITIVYSSNIVRPANYFWARLQADCPLPPNTDFMQITGDPARWAGYPYYLNITCEEGYEFKQEEYKVMGKVTAWCGQGGEWNTGSESYTRLPECGIVYCGAPNPVENGFIKNVDSVTYGGRAVYGCFDGFTLTGDAYVTCLSSSHWTTAPSCQAQSCSTLADLDNGDYEVIAGDAGDELAFSTVISYRCNPGYDLVGAQQVVCNYTWSHPPPVCKKLTCSLPSIPRGTFSFAGSLPEFGDNVTLTCDDGFILSRTSSNMTHLTCGENRTLNTMDDVCIDEDECKNPGACSATEICINTVGSFKCDCLPGYGGPLCTDLDECQQEGRGGCDQECKNLDGSYACSCGPGFLLFTSNGTGDQFLRPDETGLRPGDVLRLNQSCVRSLCEDQPAAPQNGRILSAKRTFQSNETVQIECNFGYKLEGSPLALCKAGGSWAVSAKCLRLTCSHPPQSSFEATRVPALTEVLFAEDTLTITCIRQDGKNTLFNKTLFCVPDPHDEYAFSLQGDDPECPDVDCGPLWNIPGSSNTNVSLTTYGNSFEFSCDTGRGFTLQGKSSLGNTKVTCGGNGRWGYNNLTCIGSRCSDPGTRAGTVQIVETSYEIDQVVRYNCTEPGYSAIPSDTLTCSFVGSASWAQQPPVCEDSTPPTIQCPSDLTGKLYEDITYDIPMVADNSGYTCLLLLEGPPSGKAVLSEDTTVKYAVKDRKMNQTCEFHIKLEDRTAPTLDCVDPLGVTFNSGNSGEIYISVDLVLNTLPVLDVELSKQGIYDMNAGEIIIVEVVASKDNSLRSECKVLLYGEATECLESDFPRLSNAGIDCSGNNTALSCTVTCEHGFLFQDQSRAITYTCDQGNWNTTFPLQPCIELTSSTFQYEVKLLYKTNGNMFVNFDLDACRASHATNLITLSEQISECGFNQFSATALPFGFKQQSFETVETEFELSVFVPGGGNRTDLEACGQAIAANAESLFGPTNPTTLDPVQTCYPPWLVQRKTGSYPEVTPSTFFCSDNTSTQIVSEDKHYCLPCGPGFYYDNKTCTPCEDGFYQDSFGATECKPCSNNVRKSHVPRSSQEHCYKLCPEGFFGTSGYFEDGCLTCPLDTYAPARPATECLPCPDLGSTKGVYAATSQAECYSPCPAGSYSISGYAPCERCPLNFYKESDGPATNCTECPLDTFTDTDGATSPGDCLTDAQLLCTSGFCDSEGSDGGGCRIMNHRPVCTCKPGYHGDSCENRCDICNPNPCYNGATCNPDGWSYTCTCKVDRNCTYTFSGNLRFSTDPQVTDLMLGNNTREGCEDACTANTACLAYQYVEGSYCLNYKQLTFGNQNENGEFSYIKSCVDTQLFDGARCEVDLRNDCTDTTCSDLDFCKDLVDATECVCPREGNFDEKCQMPTNICEGNPCGSHGTCQAFDSVRYICDCDPGFTGTNCETNILECELNPRGCLYGGQCKDGEDDYTCQCPNGFTGDHCQHRPDLCQDNSCHTDNGGFCTEDFRRIMANCTCGEHYDLVSTDVCNATDYCLAAPCVNGTCSSQFGGFTCACQEGFEGSLCQHDINDCALNPCMNNATCQDHLLGFVCLCSQGFSGPICETNIDDCVDACVTENTMESRDMINHCECVCKPGYTGKNCSEDIDECMTTQPCLHGGNCTNTVGDYECACEKGWSGKHCQNNTDFCDSNDDCLHGTCFNLRDDTYCRCQVGATGESCEFQKDLCEQYGLLLCANGASCSMDKGRATCECPGNYKGQSCELVKNHCSNSTICNGGECFLDDLGFKCDCKKTLNFEGDTCTEKKQVCPPCPSDGPCQEYYDSDGVRRGECLCPGGKVLADNLCQEVDTDFDLAFLESFAQTNTSVKSSRGFFVEPLTGLTISMWVVAAKQLDDDVEILSLKSSRDGDTLLTVKNREILILNGSRSITDLDADFKWHFLAVTWAEDGTVVIVRDFSVVTGASNGPMMPPPWDMYLDIYLGKSFYGYISQVSVWDVVFTSDELIAMVDTPKAVPRSGDLLLGWTYYSLNHLVIQTNESTAGRLVRVCDITGTIASPGLAGCDKSKFPDKTPPMLTKECNETATILTDYNTHQVSASRLGYEFKVGQDGSTQNAYIYPEQFLTYGAHDVAVLARDNEGNVGVCMTRTYVTPNHCETTEPEDTRVESCDANPNGREVTCPSGQLPSIPVPKYIVCGSLRSYNLGNMYTHPDKTVCGVSTPRTFSVRVSLDYTILLNCDSDLRGIMENKLKDLVEDLGKMWDTLCLGDECSNIKTDSSCPENDPKIVTMVVTVNGLRELLQPTASNLGYGHYLTPLELMLKSVEEKSAFEMPNIASAKLLADQSEVSSEPICAEGYSLLGEYCVQCGPGSYYDAASMACLLCPLNEYSATAGSAACETCTDGLGTLQRGSNSSADCVSLCQIGNMYNITSDMCQPCPKNFFQNETGQAFCYPCRPSSGTEGVGSTSASDCKDFCPGGTELRDGVCVKCLRGFFRVGFQQDACTPCNMANMTTREEGADLEEQCDIPLCPAGQYVKEDGKEKSCEPCDYGFYQSDVAEFSCKPCDDNYTTENTGADNSNQCRFVCPPGQQETAPGSLQCAPCPQGTYRNASLVSRFNPCQDCPTGFTTHSEGVDHIDDCSMAACPAGQFVNVTDNQCYSCDYGYYQPQKWQTGCEKCRPEFTTVNTGSVNEMDCKFFCPPGQEESPPQSQQCQPCARGFWRSQTLDMRFENCTACTGEMTTQGQGATSPSDCMIRICKAGTFRNSTTNECVDCPHDSYQNEDLQEECKPCLNDRQTRNKGSKDLTDCEFVCPAGLEVDKSGVSCSPCERGTYKDETMTFEKCANCSDGTTTDSTGAGSSQLCSIPFCSPGYVVSSDNSTCDSCPVNHYQPVDMPFSNTKCLLCPNNTGTLQDARVSKSECTAFCPAGKGLSNEQCSPCRRGTWNNGNNTLRFEPCQACPDGFTTEPGEGATAVDNCKIRICRAGSYRNSTTNECMECPLNSYQDEDLQDECKPCWKDRKTRAKGSKDSSDCEFVCPPGEEVDASGAACSMCARSSYKNETMTFDKCIKCKDGYTTNSTGTASELLCDVPVCQPGYVVFFDLSKCVKCPVDQYQPMAMPDSAEKCLLCPSNTGTMEDGADAQTDCKPICTAGYGLSNGQCNLCARGTWNNGNQSLRFEPCQPCSDGFTTEVEEGAAAPENCSIRDCPPGSFFDAADADSCKKCPEGFYQPLSRQKSCEQCPNDTSTFRPGSTSINNCTIKCSAGEEDDGTEKCVNCPDDKFKAEASFGQCQPCTGDFTSTPSDRTACTLQFCDVGREDRAGNCTDCPLGYYKAGRGNGACEKCPQNRTTASEASQTKEECSVVFCEVGFFSDDNMTCVLCPVGTFKNSRGNQQCSPCPNDVTTEMAGSKQKSDCFLKLCDRGQYRDSSNTCQDCSPGFFQNDTGQTTCSKCPDGYTSLQPRSTEPDSCRILCSPGFYRNDTTNTCAGCERGSYQTSTGATSCQSCSGNFTTAAENSTSLADCYITCPLGYFRVNDRTCSPCAVGEYQDEADLTSCKSCGMVGGFQGTTVSIASTQQTDCLPECGRGFYLNKAERVCNKCPIGQFKDEANLATQCSTCPEGRTTTQEGASRSADCSFQMCLQGSYRPASEQQCTECGYGFYQPFSNATMVISCTPCPNGDTTLSKGAISQDLCVSSCSAGRAYSVAQRDCVACPIGQYRPAGLNPPWCIYCPAGSTTTTTGSSSCVSTTVTPAPLVRTSVVVTVVVRIGTCDNREHIRQTIADVVLLLLQGQQGRYPDLCPTAACDNVDIMFVSFCGSNLGRKKRQTDTTATIQIVAKNVNPVLTSADDTNLKRDTQDVIQNAFYDTQPVAQTLVDNGLAIESVQSPPTCSPGRRIDGQTCSVCAKGTYSTSPVSEVCSACPEGRTTANAGTSSSLGCVAKCSVDRAYCGNNGNCTLRAGTTDDYYCLCTSKYSGTTCQQRQDESDDDNLTLVVVVSSCVGGVLLIILLVIGCIVYRYRRRPRTSSSSSDLTEYKYPHAYYNAVFGDPTMYNADIIDFYDHDNSLFGAKHSSSSKRQNHRHEKKTKA
ncbi:hypothetical protein RRG08_025221 [Elysia crispata]|uniref:Uncharacterized protein n=1 Tax=Elysia crispata TaxID=231223 RepID=A0AAE1AAJ5_9GAST|nr:hypothetical protein RRG08_025221 [Elysia crispata]